MGGAPMKKKNTMVVITPTAHEAPSISHALLQIGAAWYTAMLMHSGADGLQGQPTTTVYRIHPCLGPFTSQHRAQHCRVSRRSCCAV